MHLSGIGADVNTWFSPEMRSCIALKIDMAGNGLFVVMSM